MRRGMTFIACIASVNATKNDKNRQGESWFTLFRPPPFALKMASRWQTHFFFMALQSS